MECSAGLILIVGRCFMFLQPAIVVEPRDRAAVQSVGAVNDTSLAISQVAAISRPCSLTVKGVPAKALQIDEAPQFRLRLGE
jgi:hypothetical protein